MSDHSNGDRHPGEQREEAVRRSIEVEYWVVDGDGELTAPGNLVEITGAEREFIAPLLEIKTTPCETTAQLRRELLDRLEAVLDRAAEQGKKLVPLATPVAAENIEDLPSERTRIQDRVVGENFEYVRHCAGTHIHIEQQPGVAIDQLNVLTALDPALALINSSPYFRGSHLATGARSALYRWLAYESLPHQGELWPYTGSRTEWARRVERRYGEFVTEAVTAGFDREYVETCFDPEGAVWMPVKLRSEFSTVEWRSPDTALPSQVLRLADDVVSVVERVGHADLRIEGSRGRVGGDEVVLPEFETVKHCVTSGIQEGLGSNVVRSYLSRMGFDVSAYDPLSEEIGGREKLTPAGARELRLEFAERLERDVRQAPSVGAT
jgi:gamma-glutamyl:cysteine ligase YbdK (ATP-grasp superfamily)